LNKLAGVELARGFASVMVMLFHFSFLITDEISILNFFVTGVELFFVISGLVFARYIQQGIDDYRVFFLKRFFRLYPLYFLSLIVYYGITPEHADKVIFFFRHLLFLGTTISLEEAYFFNITYWTLPVEVEFYLLIPLLSLFFRNRIATAIFVMFALYIVIYLAQHRTAYPTNLSYILSSHLPGFILDFLIGVACYYFVFHPCVIKNKGVITPVVLVILIPLLVFLVSILTNQSNDYLLLKSVGLYNILCALAYGLLLAVITINDEKIEKVTPRYWVEVIGGISYPLYLFHMAILIITQQLLNDENNIVMFFTAMITALVLSYFTYIKIEKPLISYAKRTIK